MSYELVKFLHIIFVMLFFAFGLAGFWAASVPKYVKIISGISSLVLIVFGAIALAKLGIKPWPLWINIKIGIAFFLAFFIPIATKRFKRFHRVNFIVTLLAFFAAAYLAVFKIV